MSDDHVSLDAVGTDGGKVTLETRRQRAAADIADWLRHARDHAREDALLGELIRIASRLDKAGFAKLYATAKTEEAAMDARIVKDFERIRTGGDDSQEHS